MRYVPDWLGVNTTFWLIVPESEGIVLTQVAYTRLGLLGCGRRAVGAAVLAVNGDAVDWPRWCR